ncbi:SMI1/KNR4 family protein [Sulfurimonas sp. HSL1-6]|uniref:SMI1/KNR4 family protein n=1 Tax=Thiomicrolovo immobilis TaxID=3131935 RepID=UPI0031F8CCEF
MYKERIDAVWEKVRNYHKDNNPTIYEEMISTPPAIDDDFQRIELLLNVTLPDEFKYSYQVQNINKESQIFGGNVYTISLEEIYEFNKSRKDLWTQQTPAHDVSDDVLPPKFAWEKKWLCCADIFAAVYFMIDLRQEVQEQSSPLLAFDVEFDQIWKAYSSYTEFLEDATQQLLEHGQYDNYPIGKDQ